MIDVERTVRDLVGGKSGRGPQPNRPASPWGTFLKDGTPYLSPSQITTLLSCPARWRFRYLEGRPSHPSAHTIRGSLGHACLEALAAQTCVDLRNPGQVRDSLMPDLVKVLAHDEMALHLPKADVLLEARNLATSVAAGAGQLAAYRGPCTVEEECIVRTTTHGHAIALRYYPDLYLRDEALIDDWKFPSRAPKIVHGQAVPRVDYAIAVLLYAWGHRQLERPVDRVRITHLLPAGNKALAPTLPACTTIKVTRERLVEAKGFIDRAAAIVLSGSLGGNPIGAGWKCSPRFCDHYGVCPDAPARLGIEVE